LAVAVALAACGGEPTPAERQRLEEEFEQRMSGAVLEGYFTVEGQEQELPNKERYEIESVRKLAGNSWVIEARVRYGDHDFTAPVPVNIRWAGDTPVITLTGVPIPGVGTFTVRVLFYRGRYAGTWSSEKHGGHQFGVIHYAEDAP